MTKRFTIDVEETTQENALFENGKFVCFEDDTDEYLKKINEMSDENEQLKQSYKEFEDECQFTFNAMNRKQNDLYRKNFKLKEENEKLKHQNELLSDELEQCKAVVEKRWREYLKKKELDHDE